MWDPVDDLSGLPELAQHAVTVDVDPHPQNKEEDTLAKRKRRQVKRFALTWYLSHKIGCWGGYLFVCLSVLLLLLFLVGWLVGWLVGFVFGFGFWVFYCFVLLLHFGLGFSLVLGPDSQCKGY